MTTSNYYERQATTHLDGSPIFKTAEDERNELTVAQQIELAWSCELHPFGKLSPIDWRADRDGRMVAVIELKARTHSSSKYRTVFLNVRKWLALQLASVGMGVPALFVVKFTDGIRWIAIADVDATRHRMGGTTRMVKSISDQEPVIEVPIASMSELP